MKKSLSLLILILVGGVALCQDSTYIVSKVVQVDSVSKEELYRRAKLWVATTYNSAQNVIQLDDKDNYTLVIKAQFPVTASAGLMMRLNQGNVKYTLTIQCKDGRYKYSAENFIHECHVGYGSGGDLHNETPVGSMPIKGWIDIKGQGKSYIENLSAAIENAMSAKSQKLKSDNW